MLSPETPQSREGSRQRREGGRGRGERREERRGTKGRGGRGRRTGDKRWRKMDLKVMLSKHLLAVCSLHLCLSISLR